MTPELQSLALITELGSGPSRDDIDTGTDEVFRVPLKNLRASPFARRINDAHVDFLAGSIKEVGLIEPPLVRRTMRSPGKSLHRAIPNEILEIVVGNHRVEACRKLGCTYITVIVAPNLDDDLSAELRQIDENLYRHDLSPAERAIAVKRRKAIYQQLHPETAHGAIGNGREKSRQVGDSSSDKKINRFTQATAAATGTGERTIQRDAARGEKLGEDVLKRVVGTSLDKGEELDALAKLSDKRRESLVERAIAGEAVTARPEVKREVRDAREVELGRKIAAGNLAAPDKRYSIILADWPRKPWAWSEETGFDRAPDNHYATQNFRWAIEVFAPLVQRLAAPDAAMWMWTTAASLIDDIEIMAEAGFCALRPRGQDGQLLRDESGAPLAAVTPGGGTYRSHQVWDKELRGTGRWFIDRHELVLIGVRGNIPCPAPGTQALSLFASRRGEPSAKPAFVADEIDRLWPSLPKIELFARRARAGWDRWGADAPPDDTTAGDAIEEPTSTAAPPIPPLPDKTSSAPSVSAAATEDGLTLPNFLRRGTPNAASERGG
jgi:N6-adenosine-specific RNA methylase IME4